MRFPTRVYMILHYPTSHTFLKTIITKQDSIELKTKFLQGLFKTKWKHINDQFCHIAHSEVVPYLCVLPYTIWINYMLEYKKE